MHDCMCVFISVERKLESSGYCRFDEYSLRQIVRLRRNHTIWGNVGFLRKVIRPFVDSQTRSGGLFGCLPTDRLTDGLTDCRKLNSAAPTIPLAKLQLESSAVSGEAQLLTQPSWKLPLPQCRRSRSQWMVKIKPLCL